jgi:large subunit ribosomal protein L20
MPRSVNAVASRKRRKKILKATRGFWGARKNVYTVAKNALDKAMGYAYDHRKLKKRAFRRLWIARINAAARMNGTTYSQLINKLDKANIQLNRKTLADLALNHPEAFKAVLQAAK